MDAPAAAAVGDSDDRRSEAARLREQAQSEGNGTGGALEAFVAILTRLAFSKSAELRELRGAAFVVFLLLIPTKEPVIVVAVAAGKAYHEEAERRKSEHVNAPMGPPFARAWVATIRAIGQSDKCPEEAKAPLNQYWQPFIMKNEIETVATSVRACRVRPTRKQENRQSLHRVTLAVDASHQYLEPTLIGFFHAVKGVRKYGAAPKGALEHDAQKLLDKLKGK